MKNLALLAVILGLTGCDEFNPTLQIEEANWANSGQVEVMGRTWQITRKTDDKFSVRAERDNNDFNPFGGPAVRKSIQATRAIEQGTGCKIVRGTLYRDDSDVFFADIACKYRSES